MSILENIQANDMTNLYISDVDDELFDFCHRLIEALETNTSITSVRFDADFLGCLRSDARSKLFEVIGKIPSLQEVHLEDAVLMVIDITVMVLQAKSLRALTLNNVVLQGVSEHFDAFYQHVCLEESGVEDCVPAVKDIYLEKLHQAENMPFPSATSIGSVVHKQRSAKTA
jgi:hypothetical protein